MTDALTVPVVAEELAVTKTSHVTGRVSVSTTTEEYVEWATAKLATDQIEVQRVPIGREIDAIPPVRTDADVTIIPVVEERLVVRKQLFLLEEIHVRTKTSVEEVSMPIPVRRQRAVVERSDDDNPNPNPTDE